MKFYFISTLVLAFLQSFGQGENNLWYFSANGGLNFNEVPPAFLVDGQMQHSAKGVSTISSGSGELICYSDGVRVWDRNHSVMPNGTDLKGHNSSSQSVILAHQPSKNNEFFIFSLGWVHGQGGLYYSILDLDLNNGFGDITNEKSKRLTNDLTEKMVMAKGNCGNLWLIVHERQTNRFLSYEINQNGLSMNPVSSDIGTEHYSVTEFAWIGKMKMSSDHQKLATPVVANVVEIFDFDGILGQLSNPITIALNTRNFNYLEAFSLCFSPNAKFLYTIEDDREIVYLFQYDLSSGDANLISVSKTLIAADITVRANWVDIQIGPDNKIYINGVRRNYIGVIHQPNLKGENCSYQNEAIEVLNRNLSNENAIGLQNLVVVPEPIPELSPPFCTDTTVCSNSQLSLDATADQASYLWQDGSTDSVFSVAESGVYWVERTIRECAIRRDSITVTMIDLNFDLGQDTTLCPGETLELRVETSFDQIIWEDGSTDRNRIITSTGVYAIEGRYLSANCLITDSITVEFETLENINLGNDTIVCEGETLLLGENISSDNLVLLWPDGQMAPTYEVAQSGDYWVEARRGECYAVDSMKVTFRDPFDISIGGDRTKCPEDQLQLNLTDPSYSYEWSDGTTDNILVIIEPGIYWVKAFDGICESSDTISVNLSEECEGDNHFVPNIFSPNGDGTNDVFRVYLNDELADYKLEIYDRWGNIHYTTTDPQSTWYGESGNRELSSGIYIYHITYSGAGENRIRTLTGTTTLVR